MNCEYGCGREAHFILSNGKHCCSDPILFYLMENIVVVITIVNVLLLEKRPQWRLLKKVIEIPKS